MTTLLSFPRHILPLLLLLLPTASSSNEQDPPAAAQQYVKTTMCTTESCGISSIDNNDSSSSSNTLHTNSNMECKEYTTPLNQCYNAKTLFPNDESWGEFDIFDSMSMRSLKRQFFKSADGTCDGTSMEEDNSFILPFDDCVGPFGPPRPWGKFTLLLETAEY